MRLVKLEIQRLEGIDLPFTLQGLEPGVNVILGPNTIGKSSLGRAFMALLRPTREDGQPSLAAEFADRGGALRVERRYGPQAHWMRLGESIPAPALLEPEMLASLVIRAEDLASSDVRRGFHSDLARRIERELAGGFDLAELRGLDPMHLGLQAGGKERRDLQSARNARRKIEQEHQGLKGREDSLGALREQREAAKRAGLELQRVERALELVELRGEAQRAALKLAEFPGQLARLQSDAGERLKKLEEQLEKARAELETAKRAAMQAEGDIELLGLGKSELGAAQVQEFEQRLGQRQRTGEHLDTARLREREAAAALERVQQALGSQRTGTGASVTADDVERASAALEDLLELRATEAAAERLLDSLPEAAPDSARAQTLRRGIEALDAWLRAPRGERSDERSDERRARGLLALLALASLLLAAVAEAPAWKVLGLLLLAAGAWIVFFLRGAAQGGEAEQARSAFDGLDLEAPLAWEASAARTRRDQLANELDALERARLEFERRREPERALRRARKEIEERLESLAARAGELGFDARQLDASLLRWLGLLRQQDEASAELARAAASRAGLEAQAERQAGELATALAAFVDVQPGERDPHRLGTLLADLGQRVRDRDSALLTLRGAERDVERLRGTIAEREQELAALFAGAGLDPSERAELLRRIELLPAHSQAAKDAAAAEVRVRHQEQQLAEDPELLRRARADEREALATQRAQLAALAGKQEELGSQVARIEQELETARAGAQLEGALFAEQRAEEALAQRLEEQLLAQAGQFLLERVEEGHRHQRTGALKRAEEWFRRFTHHQFELELRAGELCARDMLQGACRGLAELSTATRVQLLLAVRLAFLEQAEGGREPLPLFLDEVLATSDLGRSKAVIETVAELARSGRQVLYLTARPEEAARWRELLGDAVALHDLAAIRGRAAAAVDPAQLEAHTALEVPARGELSLAEYGKLLGVPPLDPWREDSIHVFHLLGEHDALLRKLLELRYGSLGQLGALLDDPFARGVFSEGELEELRCRLALARALFAAWREGRGRPVDLGWLAAQPSVSDRFRTAVQELARECELDARLLIERLRQRAVPHFQEGKRNELEEALSAAGHISDAEPLGREQLHLRARSATAPFGDGLRRAALDLTETLLARLP